ncbi:MAG: hypothetical protein RMN51_03625 [Verrucomicrobiota bacterium]|nr:hypothetical protein [Limisphaera sp.]MDW8381189.1 hypothetical protein [Verrucomicrobiota bacterium]
MFRRQPDRNRNALTEGPRLGRVMLMWLGTALAALAQEPNQTNPPVSTPPAESHAVAETGSGPVRPQASDFGAFRIILDRNIFNATRSGARPSPTRPRRPARVDTLALVGTLENGSDRIAFFDGSSSEFRRAVRIGEELVGFKVEEIHFDKVYLVQGSHRWELPVGRALRREEEAEWQLSEAVGLPTGAATRNPQANESSLRQTSPAGTRADGDSGPGDEVLRRLMERRAREEQ